MMGVFTLGNAIELRGNHLGEVTALYDRLVRAAEPLGKGHITPDEVGDRCLVFDATGFPVGADGPHIAAYDLYSWPNGRTACLLDEEATRGLRICLGYDGKLSPQARRAGSRILSLGLPVATYGHSRAAVDAARVTLLTTHQPAFGQ